MMKRTKQNRWGIRWVSCMMSFLLTGGLLAGMTVNVRAAAPPEIDVIEAPENGEPFIFDFDNPPPMEEGLVPPEIGLGETFGLEETVGGDPGWKIGELLFSNVINWALSKGFDYGANEMLHAMFGDEDVEKMDEILAQQAKILGLLDKLMNTIRKVDVKKQIRAKINETSSLWTSYKNKASAIQNPNMTETQRQKSLQAYFNGSGNNYVFRVINLYTNSIEGKNMPNGNIFAAYDAYAFYNFYWENHSYNFRESLRALDATQYLKMWTLAWLSCQAHIDGNTQYASAAQAAQSRLRDCLDPPDGRKNDLMGLSQLLKSSEVKRLPEGYFYFNPLQKKVFVSPFQPALFPLDGTEEGNIYKGWTVGDAIRNLCLNYQGRSVLSDTELNAIWQSYPEKNRKSLARIFYEATGFEAFNSNNGKGSNTGFLTYRGFYAERNSNRDYSFRAYTVGGDENAQKWYFKVWLSGGDTEHDRIRSCLDVFNFEPMYRVFSATEDPDTAQAPDVATQSEIADTGVITELTGDGAVLTVDMDDSPIPITEKILIDPATTWGDGTAVGMDNLQKLLGCRVEVLGTYTYADETLAAKTITIQDDSGIQMTSGTVVSSVANAVMVLEDITGVTNGYFLPDVQEDLPTGSRISISYHWENGVKTVDSYELQDAPVPAPAPAPAPVEGPVDGPVDSEVLPQAA